VPKRQWAERLALIEAEAALFEAQDLMFDAFEAGGAQRAALAREALEISPDCADAYLLLAEETATSDADALALLEQAVAAAERALGPEPFVEDVGSFWGIIETRPYMRAREALATSLWALGRCDEAVEHRAELLRLNPTDNQGVRDSQVVCLLALERYEELDALFTAYELDDAAVILYTKALAAFRREGPSAAAGRALAEARAANPHVPAFLTGRKRVPERLPDVFLIGAEDEAADYAVHAGWLWEDVPGAVAWLGT
jgi:tetratricopeptide (TPR) repeat protein